MLDIYRASPQSLLVLVGAKGNTFFICNITTTKLPPLYLYPPVPAVLVENSIQALSFISEMPTFLRSIKNAL